MGQIPFFRWTLTVSTLIYYLFLFRIVPVRCGTYKCVMVRCVLGNCACSLGESLGSNWIIIYLVLSYWTFDIFFLFSLLFLFCFQKKIFLKKNKGRLLACYQKRSDNHYKSSIFSKIPLLRITKVPIKALLSRLPKNYLDHPRKYVRNKLCGL